MINITVIGAGNSGLATAAYLSINNISVRLWNRSYETIEKLIRTKTIHLDGIVYGDAKIDIVTTNIQEALENTDLIMVTTPANSHTDIANMLKNHLNRDVPIILNPGRSFGALVFANILQEVNSALPIIAETQTIIFTCRKRSEDAANILAMKNDVLISTLNTNSINILMEKLPPCMSEFLKPTNSMIATSIGNIGMILHCSPVLLNAGWIEYENANFKYYYDGITKSIADLLLQLDKERIEVSKKLQAPVESLIDWLKRSYKVSGNCIYDCIHNVESYKTIEAPKTLQHRYIFEDIPTGLVPLEDLGKKLNLSMTHTEGIINLANMVFNTDFRINGRTLKNLGLGSLSNSELIQFFSNRN